MKSVYRFFSRVLSFITNKTYDIQWEEVHLQESNEVLIRGTILNAPFGRRISHRGLVKKGESQKYTIASLEKSLMKEVYFSSQYNKIMGYK